jgi:hypothetical protein
VLSNFESRFPNDDRPRKAIEAAESWADCPCDEHRDAANAAANAANAARYAADASYAASYAANAARYAARYAADASYAADYAAVYAAYAYAAPARELWAGLLDEYDRLTGRTVTEPTAEDWNRLKEYAR